MPSYSAPLQDIQYLLHDVFNLETRWQSTDIDKEIAEASLAEAAKVAEKLIAPLNREGDEEGVSLTENGVKTPAGYIDAYREFSQGGWVGLSGNPDFGGQGFPKSLSVVFDEMFCAGSVAFTLYSQLTAGAALALNLHADDDLKATWLPRLYSGEFSGAMALTESHAGTDLGLIRTKAEPTDNGRYLVSGTKIFITGGDQDMSENIVHLVLARLPDAPAGSKGISLFLVPKYKLDADGNSGEFNNIVCSAVEEKMGIHASSTCVINYEASEGFLVGEPNKGLMAMFSMMNYERLSMGIQALGLTHLSYLGAVEYAKERLQSRAPGSEKHGIADPIIQHGDVKRMLMRQKAFVEAGRAFAIYVGDMLDHGQNADSHEAKMVALLTPVAKAFLTDMGFEMCVTGQQVFGGHGYIREVGMEQLVRDARITQIYEGTNGIQAMDLIGRKVLANRREYLKAFVEEILTFLETNDTDELKPFAEAMHQCIEVLEGVTDFVESQQNQNPHTAGASAHEYLHLVGYTCFSYMWLRMAVASNPHKNEAFHQAKLKTGTFFIERMLPQIFALEASIYSGADSTMALDPELF